MYSNKLTSRSSTRSCASITEWDNSKSLPGEKALVRKIDRVLLPLMIITYGIQVLDKVVLGYAAIYGLREDLNLVGQEYSWASAIFYFGYLFWEYPAVYIMKFFTPSKYLGVIMVLWGIVAVLTSTCTNFTGLAINRFVLGMLESIVAPSFLILISGWYKRSEQPIRQISWFLGTPVFAFIGSLVGYGLGNSKSSIPNWKLLYIVFGLFAVIWGPVLYFFYPVNPDTCTFLNEEEKELAKERLAGDSVINKPEWKWKHAVEGILDFKTYAIFGIAFVNTIPAGGLSNFSSLLLTSLNPNGSRLTTILLNLPGYFIQLMSLIVAGLLCTRYKSLSTICVSVSSILPLIGTALIYSLPSSNNWGRIVGLWLCYTNSASLSVAMAILGQNVTGYSKKATVSVILFLGYCAGSIVSPHCFNDSEAEEGYPSGIVAMLSCFAVLIVLPLCLRFYLIWQNKLRDSKYPNATSEDDDSAGMETDIERKSFRYLY